MNSSMLFPREKDVPDFYGEMGENQVRCQLAYPMKLAWDKSSRITSFSCHKLVCTQMELIFEDIVKFYGSKGVVELGLDLFGGCLNVRKMRGGKGRYSMHSWGIAVDLNPEENKLRWKADKARFARPEYQKYWEIVEGHGAVSLGRERNFDYMHWQFARL